MQNTLFKIQSASSVTDNRLFQVLRQSQVTVLILTNLSVLLFLIRPISADEPQKVSTSAEVAAFDSVAFARYLGYTQGALLSPSFKFAVSTEEFRLSLSDLIDGFRAGVEGEPPPLTSEAAKGMTAMLDARVNADEVKRVTAEQQRVAELAAMADQEADEFFKQNAKKPGIQSLPCGIQYEVIAKGVGPLADPLGGMQIRYTTKLLDGSLVESNAEDPDPKFVTIDQFVSGSQMVALSMPAGARWRIWLPSRLAYGAEGNPPKVGPGAALCIDQEIIAIFAPGARPPEVIASNPPSSVLDVPASAPDKVVTPD